jgi:phage baseplate assembly protein W
VKTEPFKTDLRLVWPDDTGPGGAGSGRVQDSVAGRDNLVQALQLRLSVDRGELSGLGHPRYGSRIADLIGQPMDRANRELLRRYVREALNNEPRVKEVLWVTVEESAATPGVLLVNAAVRDVLDGQTEVGMKIDVR